MKYLLLLVPFCSFAMENNAAVFFDREDPMHPKIYLDWCGHYYYITPEHAKECPCEDD